MATTKIESQELETHRAGFASIIGKPNVGKSTLMNALIGQNLSITNPKAQTTRHRIFGILSQDNYQIVYSDTPGILTPHYLLQKKMMHYVYQSLEDADVIVYLTEVNDKFTIAPVLEKVSTPIIAVVNKIDLQEQASIQSYCDQLTEYRRFSEVIPASAKYSFNLEKITFHIVDRLPEHPAFFSKDQVSDRPLRFFISEIIREKVMVFYSKEIPYACQVVVDAFVEEETIVKISTTLFVERSSQVPIMVGKGGQRMKRLGKQARKAIEAFLQKKVFLEQRVRVAKQWRKQKRALEQFGYE